MTPVTTRQPLISVRFRRLAANGKYSSSKPEAPRRRPCRDRQARKPRRACSFARMLISQLGLGRFLSIQQSRICSNTESKNNPCPFVYFPSYFHRIKNCSSLPTLWCPCMCMFLIAILCLQKQLLSVFLFSYFHSINVSFFFILLLFSDNSPKNICTKNERFFSPSTRTNKSNITKTLPSFDNTKILARWQYC
jgi:hypothetical protein